MKQHATCWGCVAPCQKIDGQKIDGQKIDGQKIDGQKADAQLPTTLAVPKPGKLLTLTMWLFGVPLCSLLGAVLAATYLMVSPQIALLCCLVAMALNTIVLNQLGGFLERYVGVSESQTHLIS